MHSLTDPGNYSSKCYKCGRYYNIYVLPFCNKCGEQGKNSQKEDDPINTDKFSIIATYKEVLMEIEGFNKRWCVDAVANGLSDLGYQNILVIRKQ